MSAENDPLCGAASNRRPAFNLPHIRRLVAGAASLAALAAVATFSAGRAAVLVERMPDSGEDYFSAIEQVRSLGVHEQVPLGRDASDRATRAKSLALL